MNIGKRHIWIIALCVYVITVVYLCLMRPDDMPQVLLDIFGIPIDQIVHFIMFFPFPMLAYGAFRPAGMKVRIHLLVLLTILAVGAGIAMGTEQLQGLSAYRSYEITDFYADMLGMTVSALLTVVFLLIKKP